MVKYAESINKAVTDVKICKMMASLGEVFKPASILEPNSGMGEILYYCNYGKDIDAYSSNKDAIASGRDVDNRINFIEENFLLAKIDKKYDLVISQIPFTYGIDMKNKKEQFRDLDYIEKMLRLLNNDGVLIALLPGRFSFDDYSLKMRQFIMDNYSLEMIVELPYEDYKVKAHNVNIIVIKNKVQRDEVLIVDYNENIDEIIHKYLLGKGDGFISNDRLKKRWNKYYHSDKFNWLNAYRPSKSIILGNVASIISGPFISATSIKDKGDLILIDRNNLINGRIVPNVNDKYIEGDTKAPIDYILKDGDLVVNMGMDGYCNVAKYDDRMEAAIIQFRYNIVRSENEYFIEFMNTRSGISFFEDYLNRHAIPPNNRISSEDIKKFEIPVFNLEDLALIEKKNKNNLKEEDIISRLNKISREIKDNRANREKHEIRIKQLQFKVSESEEEKAKKDREIERCNQELSEIKKKENQLIESINLSEELFIEGYDSILKEIESLKSEITSEINEVTSEVNEIKLISNKNTEKIDAIQVSVNEYGRLIEKIHTMVTKIHEIQDDILKKLDKALDEGEKEKLYTDLSNRIWNFIDENYDIKRSQNYDKIEAEYREKFTESGWAKLDSSTKTYLITARIVYEDLKQNDKLDFSPSCIALTKALERELFIHLFDKMRRYFKEQSKEIDLETLPDGIIYKVKNKNKYQFKYQRDNYYSLGNIPYTLAHSFSDMSLSKEKRNIKKESLKEFFTSGAFKEDSFKDKNIDDYASELAENVRNITIKYRNEAAHKNAVSKVQAIECYNLIIEIDQILIEFINKLV